MSRKQVEKRWQLYIVLLLVLRLLQHLLILFRLVLIHLCPLRLRLLIPTLLLLIILLLLLILSTSSDSASPSS